MMVGILIITHDKLGGALLSTAKGMLGSSPVQVHVLGVPQKCEPDDLFHQAQTEVSTLDQGDGVLVLTDMYGSTPSNIAARLNANDRVRVIAGVNLPMLVRIMNYPGLGLDELADKAIAGGRGGILLCSSGLASP